MRDEGQREEDLKVRLFLAEIYDFVLRMFISSADFYISVSNNDILQNQIL